MVGIPAQSAKAGVEWSIGPLLYLQSPLILGCHYAWRFLFEIRNACTSLFLLPGIRKRT